MLVRGNDARGVVRMTRGSKRPLFIYSSFHISARISILPSWPGVDYTSNRLFWSCFSHFSHPERLQRPRKGPTLAPPGTQKPGPRLENLWVPLVSWKYGRHRDRIGKPHCFNGFQVALNMLKPAFWSPAEPAGISKSRRFSFQRPFWGWRLAGDRCPLGDHFRTGQRRRAQNMKLFCRVGASSGEFCSVSF